MATLRERVNRNSHHSSRPPSSDGREVPRKLRRTRGGRKPCVITITRGKRGAQEGHKGTSRKLVPVERVKEVYDVKPDVCCRCGHKLAGEAPEPYRHQVTEIPPLVAEVTEYRLHTLTCPRCGAEARAQLPPGVPQGVFGPRLQALWNMYSTGQAMVSLPQRSLSLEQTGHH